MRIAILGLQGAFAEHEQMLHQLGVETHIIRNATDWLQAKDALVIPGGESTAIMKIMNDEGLSEPIHNAILGGLPVYGTCAGLILLDHEHLATMDIHARRNAYGRQLGSFFTTAAFKGIGDIPMTFIRAPYIEKAGRSVKVLSTIGGKIVAARQGNQLVTAFHPELNKDTRLHQYFLNIVTDAKAHKAT